MPSQVEIENIEDKRQEVGIDDAELRAEIRNLKVGDYVNLTFTANLRSFELVAVRITRIQGAAFRGKLMRRALTMPQGKAVAFTSAQVHSVVKRPT